MKISRRWQEVLHTYFLVPSIITYEDYQVGSLYRNRYNEIEGRCRYADGIFSLQLRGGACAAYLLLYDYKIIQIFSAQRNPFDWKHAHRTPFYFDSSFLGLQPQSAHTSSTQSCGQNFNNKELSPLYFSSSSRNTFSKR